MKVPRSTIDVTPWGMTDGQPVFLYRLVNANGYYIEVTNYGATLVSVVVPDRNGSPGNVVLGFPDLAGYLQDVCCIGSTIGRFANRIGGGTFTLNGIKYTLDRNDGNNTNHGGSRGFHKRIFTGEAMQDEIVLRLVSEEGDAGFPGRVMFQATYRWTDDNELMISHRAETDRDTIVSFTNHAYFNLSAAPSMINDHRLRIDARRRLEITGDYIPTGKILPSGDLEFTGQMLREKYTNAGGRVQGLNSYYLFDEAGPGVRCILTEETKGRRLSVSTSYPGVQLYTGDFLTSVASGHHGAPYGPFEGVCLECQFPPDSPNHPGFPSTTLQPGKIFNHKIMYKFSLTEGV